MSSEKPRKDPEAATGGAEKTSQKERAIAEALATYVDRLSREETVDIDAFCKAAPELEKELRPLLESLNEMDGLSSALPPDAAEEAGEKLPDMLSGHKILGEIGAGGMGRVLLGLDERLGRKVALTTLNRR
jgi:hypothetical protein